jgi:dTDP-4-dehydrorhamnose reductase
VGWELQRRLSAIVELTACDRSKLDITSPTSITSAVKAARPQVVINGAGYTDVEKAESDRAMSHAANALAPGIFAEEAKKLGALLVHYSTDYVFDGEKPGPYVEEDMPNPLNVYGRTKLEGENAIKASGCRHLILRTSWLYAPRGRNFLLKILRLAGRNKELRVVNDQIGAPTTAAMVAEETVRVLTRYGDSVGLYHLTASGEASWYTFAQAIVRGAGLSTPVVPISSAEYPAAARRPAYSKLDSTRFIRDFDGALPSWEAGLAATLDNLRGQT